MPIATPEKYAEMLDAAKSKSFAFPAINVSSSQTLNAALAGFSEAGSDGIIQVSTGGAEYLSGPTVKDMVTGSVAFAAYALEVAKKYPVNIALHTDHCPKDKLDGFVRPLLEISRERVKNGQDPLGLVYPYSIYQELHLEHHRSGALSSPFEDTESFYVTRTTWNRLGPVLRFILEFNNTIVGRLTIGPVISLDPFVGSEVKKIIKGDYSHVGPGHYI